MERLPNNAKGQPKEAPRPRRKRREAPPFGVAAPRGDKPAVGRPKPLAARADSNEQARSTVRRPARPVRKTSATPTSASGTGSNDRPPSQPRAVRRDERPTIYVAALVVLTLAGLAGVWRGNQLFAPEMYHHSGPVAFAEAFSKGQNFATFDLNINIREMRDEHIKRMKKTPDVVVLGASHWQEAHTELLPSFDFYNAHVHRDYYEDMLAVVEMFQRHGKMPKKMMIAIRDRLFTPVADRTDFLWLPGIPHYERMAVKLGIEPHAYWETAPVQRWKELLTASMLFTNVSRWYKAPVKPHATNVDHHETLDTLRPGGSIYWSSQHQNQFTQERSKRLSLEFAAENFNAPPKIDPKGLAQLDRLFSFLKQEGVEVYLVHPPFNPIYWNATEGGAYRDGVAKIEEITQNFAKKYDFKVFGSFNPAGVGCTADMYIDAEHSNPECLGKLLAQFAAIARPATTEPASQPASQPEKPAPAVVAAAKPDVKMTAPPTIAGRVAWTPLPKPVETVAQAQPESVIPSATAARPDETRVVSGPAQAAADLPPLPVQSSLHLPPLPERRPFIRAFDCGSPAGTHADGSASEPGARKQPARLDLDALGFGTYGGRRS